MPLVRQPRVARLAFLVFLAARPLVDSFLLSPSLLPLSNKGLRRSPADQQHEVGVKVTPQVTGRKHHGPPTPLHQKLQLPPPLLEVEVVEGADEEEEALTAGEGKLVNRRAYFEQLLYKTVATVAVSGASSLIAPPRRCLAGGLGYEEPGSRWQPEGNPKQAASWFPLLKKCYESLEDVLANWEKYTVRQDGDAIRRLIGTIGVSSPLSSLRKAFTSIRDAEEESQGDIDVIEYVEAYMEVLTALGDAENDLYSANFADYSGGGGTKGSQFITKAQKSLKIARDDFKVVNKILGI